MYWGYDLKAMYKNAHLLIILATMVRRICVSDFETRVSKEHTGLIKGCVYVSQSTTRLMGKSGVACL